MLALWHERLGENNNTQLKTKRKCVCCCFLGQNTAKGHGKQNGKCVFYDRIQQQRAMDNKAENVVCLFLRQNTTTKREPWKTKRKCVFLLLLLLFCFVVFCLFSRTEYSNKGPRKTNHKMRCLGQNTTSKRGHGKTARQTKTGPGYVEETTDSSCIHD